MFSCRLEYAVQSWSPLISGSWYWKMFKKGCVASFGTYEEKLEKVGQTSLDIGQNYKLRLDSNLPNNPPVWWHPSEREYFSSEQRKSQSCHKTSNSNCNLELQKARLHLIRQKSFILLALEIKMAESILECNIQALW